MLEVQRLLSSGTTLEELSDQFGLRITHSPCQKLVILNYDQIDSPKHHPVARECRGLTLEVGSWAVVARSFPRFFNAGECPEEEKRFDWTDFVAEEKCDGSLMLLYHYDGHWRVNTRGSFALGEIAPGVGKIWEECFYLAVNEKALDWLSEKHTYVFEFCSPWNKVVRHYDEPTLFLLTAFHNATGSEMDSLMLDTVAHDDLNVRRPERFPMATLNQVAAFVNEQEATFEGCVLRDRKGMRIKVKNKAYVALHAMKGNGNLFLTKNLVPLVLSGEVEETLAYFPEAAQRVFDVVEKLEGAKGRLKAVWDVARSIDRQKDFAMYVNQHTSLSSLLFEARKTGKTLDEIWRESGDRLLKTLF